VDEEKRSLYGPALVKVFTSSFPKERAEESASKRSFAEPLLSSPGTVKALTGRMPIRS
jgi:hypothetical protein